MNLIDPTTFEPRIADWLALDPIRAPESVMESVMAALPGTRQANTAGSIRRPVVPTNLRGFAFGNHVIMAGVVGALVVAGTWLAMSLPESGRPEPQDAPVIAATSPSVAPTTGRTAFISTAHQYAFMLPPDWTPRAGADATVLDRFDGPDGRVLTVRFDHLPEGGATDPWVSEHVPVRVTASGYCVRSSSFESTLVPFEDSHVGDIDARIRRSCGFVDAVATSGDRAWIVSLDDPATPDGDLMSFRRLTDTFRSLPDPDATPTPTPTPTPAPTLPADWIEFSSDVMGYSLRHPAHWQARSLGATEDYFESEGGNQLWVDRRPAPSMTSVVAWADLTIPDRSNLEGDDRVCMYGGTLAIPALPPAKFEATEIVGRPAAIRSQCSHVDAVIDLDDGILVLTYRSPTPTPWGDDEFFDLILAGLRLAEDD